MTDVPGGIRSGHLQNTSEKMFHLNQLAWYLRIASDHCPTKSRALKSSGYQLYQQVDSFRWLTPDTAFF
jgi:hypothetical protein